MVSVRFATNTRVPVDPRSPTAHQCRDGDRRLVPFNRMPTRAAERMRFRIPERPPVGWRRKWKPPQAKCVHVKQRREQALRRVQVPTLRRPTDRVPLAPLPIASLPIASLQPVVTSPIWLQFQVKRHELVHPPTEHLPMAQRTRDKRSGTLLQSPGIQRSFRGIQHSDRPTQHKLSALQAR